MEKQGFVIIMCPLASVCVCVSVCVRGIMEPCLIGVDEVRDVLNITLIAHCQNGLDNGESISIYKCRIRRFLLEKYINSI